MSNINIIFDGPSAAVSGRFIEVEDDDGKSITVGKWVDRGDGTWALVIPKSRVITTVKELNELSEGSVVRSSAWTIACRYDLTRGVVFGVREPFPWSGLQLPVTVLWEPKP